MHFSNFFTAYSEIAAYMRRIVAESKVNGLTRSRFGRKHPIWAYKSDKSWVRTGGERTAGNAPIQGGLADMMKLIMIRVDEALKSAGLKDSVRMVMNIHDALEFYVREDVPPQRIIDLLTPVILQKTPWTEHWPLMKPEWHIWKKWGSPTELRLDEDYQILGMGEAIDIGEQEDEDEEDDEGPAGVPVPGERRGGLPGVLSGQAVQGPLRGGVGADRGVRVPPGRRNHSGCVIVRVDETPEVSAVQRLVNMLAEFPGPNRMLFRMPEGTIALSEGTALSPDDEARISLLLGGAQVFWDVSTVDGDRLAEGLALLHEAGKMEVTQGISTDYAKEKFNVTLDEADLIRLAGEYDLPEPRKMTTFQACRLLTLEAERFVLIQAPRYGRKADESRDQLWGPGGNREQFAAALADVTGRDFEECRRQLRLPPKED